MYKVTKILFVWLVFNPRFRVIQKIKSADLFYSSNYILKCLDVIFDIYLIKYNSYLFLALSIFCSMVLFVLTNQVVPAQGDQRQFWGILGRDFFVMPLSFMMHDCSSSVCPCTGVLFCWAHLYLYMSTYLSCS